MKLNTDYDADFEELDPEDEKDVKPMTKVLVFLGLMVVAAIICAILWNVTHNDKKDGGTEGSPVKGAEESVPEEELLSEGSRKPDTETVPEGTGEPGAEMSPEEGGEADPGKVSTESGEADSGKASTESGEADSGKTSAENSGSESGTGPEQGKASAQEPEAPASNAADNSGSGQDADEKVMDFAQCEDTVTPKEVINLRSTPSTAADNIVSQAANGELLRRTGVNNDTGWSRVEYNGQTVYAVSSYLTTDLTAQPPAAASDTNSVVTKDGRTIVFTDCDDNISPKMYVNLRLEPSTSEGNDTVHCRLEYGQIVHRTGVSEDSGWSRVEYDGVVLYVVTSYMYVVEEEGQ